MKPRAVIFSAPAGWGKTKTADAMRQSFECASVVDEWEPRQGVTPGALHLTNIPPDRLEVPDDAYLVAIGWVNVVTRPSPALTMAQAEQAFYDWERDYRANPDDFLTAAEKAALELADIAKARAIHFLALLRQQNA